MLITLALLSAPSAHAQDVSGGDLPELNAQLFRPSIDSRSLLWTDDTTRAPDGDFGGRALLHWAYKPLVYNFDNGDEIQLISNVFQMDLMGAYTWNRFRFGVDLPVYLRSTGEATDGETGLGDIAVDVKASIFERHSSPVGLAINGRVGLPTATVDAPLGNGGVGWEVAAIVDRSFGDLLLAANVGTRGVKRVELENVVWDDQLLFRLGAGYAITNDAGVSLDVAGNSTYANMGNIAGVPIEALLGGYTRVGTTPLVARGGVGTGITSGIGTPRVRTVLALAWEPTRNIDSDGDGLLDVDDACPQEPEDKDSWEDEDGCPEPTQLTIKVVDEQGQPIEGARLVMSNGTQASGASHNMGLSAGDYTLTLEAEGYEPGQATVTVADGGPTEHVQTLKLILGTVRIEAVDQDGNFVPGASWLLDGKPQGELSDGVVEAPVRPGEHRIAAEAAGYLRGSKEVDVQPNDTVTVKLSLKPSTVKVTQQSIDLGGSVYFETNKDVIKTKSYALLDDVASVMKEHPSIKLVGIEGHTDVRGDDDFNQDLSERRAAAVRSYLINKGVEADRLVSSGFGETKPVDDRNTSEAWEKNRRVDFFIKERATE